MLTQRTVEQVARPLALLIFIVLGILVVFLLGGAPPLFGGVDLVQYWSSAVVVSQGGNPYSGTELAGVQSGVVPFPSPVQMWNPPLLIPLIYPLSLLSFETCRWSWLLLSSAAMVGATVLAASLFSERFSTHRRRFLLLLFLSTFYPSLLALYYGQTSAFILLVFTFYLTTSLGKGRVESSFWGGVALSVTFVKPHLLHLVYISTFLHAWRFSRWRTIIGMSLGGALLLISALALNPNIFGWYLQAMKAPPIIFKTPTLGSWLQGLYPAYPLVCRFLPTFLSDILLLTILIKGGRSVFDMSLLYILVPLSLITAPYGWVYDQVLLVPSILWIIWKGLGFWDRGCTHPAFVVGLSLIVSELLFYAIPGILGQEIYIWFPAIIFALGTWMLHLEARAKPPECPTGTSST